MVVSICMLDLVLLVLICWVCVFVGVGVVLRRFCLLSCLCFFVGFY